MRGKDAVITSSGQFRVRLRVEDEIRVCRLYDNMGGFHSSYFLLSSIKHETLVLQGTADVRSESTHIMKQLKNAK